MNEPVTNDHAFDENAPIAELDQLLDGELSDARAEACAMRLAADGSLADTLANLRADRDLRAQFWTNCLPTSKSADLFAQRAIRAARRNAWQSRWNGYLRFGGAAAACILVGFVTGWSGRGHAPDAATPYAAGYGGGSHVRPMPAMNASDTPSTSRPGGYYVELTDANGHPVAVQRFDNLNDARAFANDLTNVQTTSTRAPAISLTPTPPPADRPLVVPVSQEY